MRVAAIALVVGLVGCGHSSAADGPDGAAPIDTMPADAAPYGSAQLAAMWPPVARTGQTVLLEGTFSGHPLVDLPGGATAVADVLGDHRARIVVPPSATVGDATGTGGAAPGGHVFFHAVTYETGLRPFTPYEQADGAHAEPQPAEQLIAPGAVALGNAIYVLGGYRAVDYTFTNHVEVASIHADGTLGDFTILPDVSLVTGRNEFASVMIDGYVYVLGGSSGVALATIERAPIGADGTLGTFEELPEQLSVARVGATAVVVGTYLYVMGGTGFVGASTLDTVERAMIEPDGTLDAFEPTPLQLVEGGRADAGAIVSGNQLYVYGGARDTLTGPDGGPSGNLQPTIDVETATIDADGTIEPFGIAADVSLAYGRIGFASAVIGDDLYLFGGGPVEHAPIQADGTLGTFTPTGIDTGGTGVAVAIAGNDAYVIGGQLYEPVRHATIDASGAIGASAETTSVLATPASSSGLVASGSAVYLLGGSTGPAAYSAAIQAGTITDGLVGDFATVPDNQLVTARADFGTLTVGSDVYVIGGDTAGGAVGSIERATIGADGTLGPFAVDPDTALVTPRSQFATAVIDRTAGSFVLVLGGLAADGTTLDTIEQAPLLPDGSLGPFSLVGHTATPRRGCSAFVTMNDISEVVFLVGGRDGTVDLGDVERGIVDRTMSNAFDTFAVLNTGLTTPRAGSATAVLGDHVYVFGGGDGTGPLDSIELATFTDDPGSPLTMFAPLPGVTLAEPRADARCTTIANQVYCFGGAGASGALSSVEAAPLQ